MGPPPTPPHPTPPQWCPVVKRSPGRAPRTPPGRGRELQVAAGGHRQGVAERDVAAAGDREVPREGQQEVHGGVGAAPDGEPGPGLEDKRPCAAEGDAVGCQAGPALERPRGRVVEVHRRDAAGEGDGTCVQPGPRCAWEGEGRTQGRGAPRLGLALWMGGLSVCIGPMAAAELSFGLNRKKNGWPPVQLNLRRAPAGG